MTWIADALVLLALGVMTLAAAGLLRLGSVALRLHAAAKASAMGVVPLCVVAAATGAGLRALLVGAFVLVTAPVASHMLAAGLDAAGEHDD
jgi:multicomponent Na+:H+ antiporter subunit G